MAADADMQALQNHNDKLTSDLEARDTTIAELETELEERPSAAEVGLIRERVTELESESQTKDLEVACVQYLAAQGEKALQLAKDTAKRSVLVDMGLSPADDNSKNPAYLKRCGDVDEMTDISAINSIANSNFGGKTGRQSSINGYQSLMTDNKKPAMRGNTL